MNWGIMATGRIAHVFADALNYVEDASLYAVASRTYEKAKQFQEQHGVEQAYGSYEEMVNDPKVDVIYVATPMSSHYEDVKLCLRARKHVLCEKCITIDVPQFEELIALSKEMGVFFMEAMWMKFHPGFQKALAWAQEGRIGKLQMVRADINKFMEFDAEDRVFKKELGGGSLLDLGVYTTTLACAFLGTDPEQIFACYAPTPDGSDYVNSILMQYPGAFAAMNSGFGFPTPVSAIIMGEKGRIEFDQWFIRTNSVTLYDHKNNQIDRFELPHACNGYENEIVEVERCLREGLTESPINTLEDTRKILCILDQVRKQWNLQY